MASVYTLDKHWPDETVFNNQKHLICQKRIWIWIGNGAEAYYLRKKMHTEVHAV